MSDSVELKFLGVVYLRLIYDAWRRDEAAMEAAFAGPQASAGSKRV